MDSARENTNQNHDSGASHSISLIELTPLAYSTGDFQSEMEEFNGFTEGTSDSGLPSFMNILNTFHEQHEISHTDEIAIQDSSAIRYD